MIYVILQLRYLLAFLACGVLSICAQNIDPNLDVNVLADQVSSGMEMDISNDGRVFIAERNGKVKLFTPGKKGTDTIIDLKADTRCEGGLIGLALSPDFNRTGWIYMYHTVADPNDKAFYNHHLGRFTFKDNKIDPKSEKVLLKVRASSQKRIHEAGSIAFDKDGFLYLSCGDNQIRSEYLFSLKTSANSNDLRGKILRVKPKADGTYDIPEGNLFKPGTPKTKPEIYIMGLRNPFRIHVDKHTGWLLWGENGPPNNWVPGTKIDKKTVPLGYDEFNLAKNPGFRGYPMVIANQQAFKNYDPNSKKEKGYFDPQAPVNDHKENTGIKNLPAAQPPLIWYEGLQKEFPELGKGGESAIAGPIFRSQSSYPQETRLPAKYEGNWIIGEYSRGWIKMIKLDKNGNYLGIEPILSKMNFGRPSNIKIGPKGRLHILYFNKGKGSLIRLENKGQLKTSVDNRKFIEIPEKAPKQISKLKGYKLMQGSDCFACHKWTQQSIAPNYLAIAKKYAKDTKAPTMLANKIINGGTGVWGQLPMIPHPNISESDAMEMVKAIMAMADQRVRRKK